MSYVRDRFDDLQKNQNVDDETNKDKKKKDKMEKTLDGYLQKCNELRHQINDIRDDTNTVNDALLHKQFYRFEDLQNEINPIIKRSEDICMKVHGTLKEMTIDRYDLDANPNAETKMKYMQYTTLKENFQDVINKHMECVKRYEVLLEEFKKRIQQSIQGEYNEESVEIVNETQAFIGNYLLDKHTAELELRDIQQRHTQLLEIEDQIRDVRELFVKIAILVEQQQDSINRAEHHAAISSRTVEMANEQLVKAEKTKKKVNKLRIILIVVGIIIGLIIIIMLIK